MKAKNVKMPNPNGGNVDKGSASFKSGDLNKNNAPVALNSGSKKSEGVTARPQGRAAGVQGGGAGLNRRAPVSGGSVATDEDRAKSAAEAVANNMTDQLKAANYRRKNRN